MTTILFKIDLLPFPAHRAIFIAFFEEIMEMDHKRNSRNILKFEEKEPVHEFPISESVRPYPSREGYST
jgi:hypothetical protein